MKRSILLRVPVILLSVIAAVLAFAPTTLAFASGGSYIGQFHNISTVASTVPANGDVNPYGTFVVPTTTGHLTRGNVLVSNFNNASNLQGTGKTIVQISPHGSVSLFAQLSPGNLHGACPGGVGLTTALVALKRGWVIVGSLPTSDGSSATMQAGCLIVLDSQGHPVETFSGSPINGPWDMTVRDNGGDASLFVTNVLNGTVAAGGSTVNRGTIVRLNLDVPWSGHGKPRMESETIIGSGFSERTDPSALVVGPTGVGFHDGTLYIADSVNSRITAIPDALSRRSTASTGKNVTSGGALDDPLGLTIAPNGHILTVNGNNGKIVETTPGGKQVATKVLDNTVVSGSQNGSGCLFGLATVPAARGVYFVDDCTNQLNVLN